MKKVFLLFGVAALSSASAQQKDLFDIQKHIKEKQTAGKKAAEKKAFVLPPFKKFTINNPFTARGLSYMLRNGNKVFILPQDNMPCVVPDMKLFQTTPNPGYIKPPFYVFPYIKRPGQIPNGAAPLRLMASR